MHDGRTNGGTNFGLEFLNEASNEISIHTLIRWKSMYTITRQR
jgi:hypothetical protein